MKKSIPFFKLPSIAVFVISCIILFSACKSMRQSQGGVYQKNWVNWQITFKGNPSEKEKKMIFAKLERYILLYLAHEDNNGILIDRITFNRTINDSNIGIITASTNIAATEAVPTPVVGPRPPKKPVEEFPNIEIAELGER